MSDVFGGTILVVLLVVLGGVVAWDASHKSAERDFIRDCFITGAHIIDSDTVIVCKVLKVRQTETVLPNDNTKPEVTL